MLAEADPTATRFERVGIGRSYLAPNSEAPNGDGVLPTNGESGYARDGVVAMRPGSTISPSIPDNVAHYTMTPTVEKVLGTLKEYFSIRPVSHIVDLFRMCVCGLRPSCNRARDLFRMCAHASLSLAPKARCRRGRLARRRRVLQRAQHAQS